MVVEIGTNLVVYIGCCVETKPFVVNVEKENGPFVDVVYKSVVVGVCVVEISADVPKVVVPKVVVSSVVVLTGVNVVLKVGCSVEIMRPVVNVVYGLCVVVGIVVNLVVFSGSEVPIAMKSIN